MDTVMHRKAKFRYGLCGAQTTIENSTLEDDKVNCQKCLEILAEATSFNENSRSRAERRNNL